MRGQGGVQNVEPRRVAIRQEREEYYSILGHTQKGTLDVTPWMEWFLACLGRAIDGARTTLSAVLQKARFWQTLRDVPINERQRVVLNRLLDGFEGNLTTSKWSKIVCTSATASVLTKTAGMWWNNTRSARCAMGTSTAWTFSARDFALNRPLEIQREQDLRGSYPRGIPGRNTSYSSDRTIAQRTRRALPDRGPIGPPC